MARFTLASATVLLCLDLGGCGHGPPSPRAAPPPAAGWTTYHDERRGYTVSFPSDWHHARESFTPPLIDPREIVSLGSYPLRFEAGARCTPPIDAPVPALDRLGPGDVLVSIQELSGAGRAFPLRPHRFRLRRLDLSYPRHPRRCVARSLGSMAFQAFGEAGRRFYLVAITGRGASKRTRRDLQRVIDSFRFEPAARPGGRRAQSDAEHGFEVSLPDGWQRAETPVSPLSDPREVLAAGTFPLRHRPSNCTAFAGSARQDLGPRDALVTVQERGKDPSSAWADFPPRPASFDAEPAEPPEPGCGDRPGTETWWLPFTDAGRHFYALVVIGPKAPPRVHDEAFGLLDSLRFDPAVQPDWRSSG